MIAKRYSVDKNIVYDCVPFGVIRLLNNRRKAKCPKPNLCFGCVYPEDNLHSQAMANQQINLIDKTDAPFLLAISSCLSRNSVNARSVATRQS